MHTQRGIKKIRWGGKAGQKGRGRDSHTGGLTGRQMEKRERNEQRKRVRERGREGERMMVREEEGERERKREGEGEGGRETDRGTGR